MSGHFVKTLRNTYSEIGAFIKVNKIFEWIDDYCDTNQGSPLRMDR